MQNLPDGVRVPALDDAEMMDEMFSQSGFAMETRMIPAVLLEVLV